MTEANSRIMINKLLLDAEWKLPGSEDQVNVKTEVQNSSGFADYVLFDGADFPICVIEAKKELLSPLVGKEQARGYAEALHCRFIILSNGIEHFFWDIENGSPTKIHVYPTLEQLVLRKEKFNPNRNETEIIENDYIAQTQLPNFDRNPSYIDEKKREDFLRSNNLRLLRPYQLEAVNAVKNGIAKGRDRFLLEMATGTGKTVTSCAIMKMFLRLYDVKRVLFLVDRIELESQAQKEFDEILKNDFRTVVWKENKSDWMKAEIVVSTVQSFVNKNKYKKIFKPDHFDLVISDEAHRSLGARSRKVFEYFIGFKLGLTATPKDYLKSVDLDSISATDPKQYEKRLLLDTYTTFGCESGEPTFRYSLSDGVKDGFLINPKVIDARTEITTELLSETGYVFQGVDEEGNDVEEAFTQRDFEKKFFSENTNFIFCETFLKHALRDPYTKEIGKTLIFCVSQTHAAKITQTLNELAEEIYPQKYNSDFAVQVTSNVENAQRMTIDFRNNSLNGHSGSNPHYRTSKTRVCVTVGMMTTGYDCTDVLNICMMRPVYSPSEFIQMKGRGTRKCDFSQLWITKSETPDFVDPQKSIFNLFDFFGNYDYFEKDFDYDEVLRLPSKSNREIDAPPVVVSPDDVISTKDDPLAELREILISQGGMKIDRELYKSFKSTVMEDLLIKDVILKQDFEEAERAIKERIFDTSDGKFSLEKLRKSLGVDRKLTMRELLMHVFDIIDHIPSRRECIDEEFDRFDSQHSMDDEVYDLAKEVFEAYAADDEFRNIIESKKFADLSIHPSGDAFKNLPKNYRQTIPAYIKQNVNMERLAHAG